jgi:hypothetical protein
VCVTPPLAALPVSVYVPVGVLRAVLIVIVDEPEVLMELGLKLALARFGRPFTLRVTVPEKPAFAAMLTA